MLAADADRALRALAETQIHGRFPLLKPSGGEWKERGPLRHSGRFLPVGADLEASSRLYIHEQKNQLWRFQSRTLPINNQTENEKDIEILLECAIVEYDNPEGIVLLLSAAGGINLPLLSGDNQMPFQTTQAVLWSLTDNWTTVATRIYGQRNTNTTLRQEQPNVMSVSAPISPGICKALERCKLSKGTVGLWEVCLLGEIERYRLTTHDDQPDAAGDAARIKSQINGLHRSLKRSIRATAAKKHWNKLDPRGKIFVNMKLQMAERSLINFANLNFADPIDRKKLEAAAADARKWLGEKRGSEHSSQKRALADAVARIYQIATQKKPGISSSETAAGPNYATPFENLLMVVMAEAGEPMSVEAARSMYRSRLNFRRPKPQA